LRRTKAIRRVCLQKNLKTFVYLGTALLVIVAALFSSTSKKTPAQQAAAKGQPPQPTLQDNTDNNVQDLKNQLKAEREKEQAASGSSRCSWQRSHARVCDARATSCRRGLWADRRCRAMRSGPALPASGLRTGGLWTTGQCAASTLPEQQQAQLIAAKERERADESRFASNLVYARAPDQPQQAPGQMAPAQYRPATQRQEDTSLQSPRAAGEPQEPAGGYKRPLEAISIQPKASLISSTRVRFSTRY
jgi:hypothetical protein